VWTTPAFRDWSIVDGLARISAPCLAIQGRDDPYGSPSQVHTLLGAIGPGAKAVLLAECEHTAQRERETLTTSLVSQFAREVMG
jgi:pimeloyl-ACP methyl ester carboxylesterase